MKQLTDKELVATILHSLRETRKQFAHLYGPKRPPKRAAKARRKASARAKPKRRTA